MAAASTTLSTAAAMGEDTKESGSAHGKDGRKERCAEGGVGKVESDAEEDAEDVEYFVTLENWAVEDPRAINDEWGFCVWAASGRGGGAGKEAEGDLSDTFHARLTRSGGYGNVALTLRVCPPRDEE
jgi:hypothetical protein